MDFNAMARRIADHVHGLIVVDASSCQVYSYFEIAHAMGIEVADVRRAIGRGGFNGITFGVNAAEREELTELLANKRR